MKECDEIIASCDGLLLYVAIFYDKYIINPLTGHSISLPSCEAIFSGLYFHNSTSTYRVLKCTHEIVVMTNVLVVGEQSWRRLSCHHPCRPPCHLPDSDYDKFLDLNGCLFWLVFKEQCNSKQPDTIMAFDTESEVYDLRSLPTSEKLLNLAGNLMGVDGELGLWVADNCIIDVWIMKESWVKRYSINYFNLTRSSFQFGMHNDCWVGGVAVFVKDNELLIDVSETQYFIRCNLKSRIGCCNQGDTIVVVLLSQCCLVTLSHILKHWSFLIAF